MNKKISTDLFAPHGYNGVDWAMTFAEKFAMVGILSQRKPRVSIEIGTLNGGSLSVISHYSEKVYSIDPNPEVKDRLKNQYKNVEFITEKSEVILPGLVDEINHKELEVGFILVDGDHTEKGVRSDIVDVLNIKPKAPLWILMHDSFNPDCRRAMKSVDWASNPFVHWVNYDFIPGFLSSIPDWEDQMWCGFALAYLDASKRLGELRFGELLGRQFMKLLPVSIHGEDIQSADGSGAAR